MGCPIIQDLPYPHDHVLDDDEKKVVYDYCVHVDLWATGSLYRMLKQSIELRHEIGKMYHLDLRSKSDAQISEAVIVNELRHRTGFNFKRPSIPRGTTYHYDAPPWMRFFTPDLQHVFKVIKNARFVVNDNGYIDLPDSIGSLQLHINGTDYQLGIGGLHSKEKSQTIVPNDDELLIDRDVSSYYPSIILNNELYPAHMGRDFLEVYQQLYDRRLHAKETGDIATSESLKITINGCFGKLGDRWSKIYSPKMMMQTTVTGQLALLQLIEMVTYMGGKVVSANTDGIAILVGKFDVAKVNEAIADWEVFTGFKTDADFYAGLYSRDVNNYVAVTTKGKIKTKGAFNSPMTMKFVDRELLKMTPKAHIIAEAAVRHIAHGESIKSVVKSCDDFAKFVYSCKVNNGGAAKDKQYLGKVIRWYYKKGEFGQIKRMDSGNKVAMTDGAYPCQQFPAEVPKDLDYETYVRMATELVGSTGIHKNETQLQLF